MKPEDDGHLFPLPRCVCGHVILTHHITPTGVRTWCSTWAPARCLCTTYTQQPEDEAPE